MEFIISVMREELDRLPGGIEDQAREFLSRVCKTDESAEDSENDYN
jgi:hypothetical protein